MCKTILCEKPYKEKQMTDSKAKIYPNHSQSWGIAGLLILGMLLFSPIHFIMSKFIGNEASMLLYYLFAVGGPFLIANATRKRKTDKKSFNLRIENVRIIPLLVLTTIGLLFGIILPISSLIPVPEIVKDALMGMAGQSGFFSFVLMVIAAPILEELIFRGIILDGLLDKYSPMKSILISSFLFGIVHLNPWQLITGLIIGIFAGWIYYKTRSLSLAIIIHASANLNAYLFRLISDADASSMDDTLVEGFGGVFNLVMVIVVSVLTVGGCIYLLKREFDNRLIHSETQHAL